MRRFTRVLSAAVTATTCYGTTTTKLYQSSAPPLPEYATTDAVVRTRGRGPSSELLKGVDPYGTLHVEANLHPADLEIQRRVLAVSMPTLEGISVSQPPDVRDFIGSTSDGASASTPPDMEARMQVLESVFHDQLTTLANLIVERMEVSTGLQLTAMESAQRTQVQSVTEVLIASIRAELRGIGAAPSSSSGSGVSEQAVHGITAKVTQAVKDLLKKEESHTVHSLETRVEKYFSQLESNVRTVVHSAAPSAGLSEEVSTAIFEAVQQASRVQQESITSVLEDLLKDRGVSQDNNALQEFIEGALRTATDDIRVSTIAGVKKLLRNQPAPSRATATSDDAGDTASVTNGEDIIEKVQNVWELVERTSSEVSDMDDSVKAMAETQKTIVSMLEDLKSNLGNSTPPSATTSPSSTQERKGFATVDRSLEQLKSEMARLAATMEVSESNTKENILSGAQVIVESVTAAIEEKTKEAIEKALQTIQTQPLQAAAVPSPSGEAPVSVAVDPEVSKGIQDILAGMKDFETRMEATQETRLVSLAQEVQTHIQSALQGGYPASEGQFEEKLSAMKTELVSVVQQEMSKTHEVNLTPMYQYIDSMLNFVKDEHTKQQEFLDKKLDALAESVQKQVGHSTEAERAEFIAQLKSSVTAAVEAARPPPADTPAVAAAAEPVAVPPPAEVGPDLRALLQTHADNQIAATKDLFEAINKLEATNFPDIMKQLNEHQEIMKALKAQLTAMEAAAAERNKEILESLSAAAATDDDIRQQLSAISSGLEDLSSTRNMMANTQLEELQQLIEKRFDVLQSRDYEKALKDIEASVAAQTSTLNKLAEAKKEPAPLITKEEQRQWSDLRSESTDVVQSIGKLVQQIESAKEADKAPLLASLKEQLGKLEAVAAKENKLNAASSAKADAKPATSDDVLAAVESVATRLLQNGTHTLQGVRAILDSSFAKEGKETRAHVNAQADDVKAFLSEKLAAISAVITELSTRPSKGATAHWWWLLANAVVIVATITLCMYYLMACLLVAFVPLPTVEEEVVVDEKPAVASASDKRKKVFFLDRLL